VSDAELERGRQGAANDDVKFISQEGEWFLAGVLDGLPDGRHHSDLSASYQNTHHLFSSYASRKFLSTIQVIKIDG
jgi:hypothetical protein